MAERKKDMDLEGNTVPGACLVSLLQLCVTSNFFLPFRKTNCYGVRLESYFHGEYSLFK